MPVYLLYLYFPWYLVVLVFEFVTQISQNPRVQSLWPDRYCQTQNQHFRVQGMQEYDSDFSG